MKNLENLERAEIVDVDPELEGEVIGENEDSYEYMSYSSESVDEDTDSGAENQSGSDSVASDSIVEPPSAESPSPVRRSLRAHRPPTRFSP